MKKVIIMFAVGAIALSALPALAANTTNKAAPKAAVIKPVTVGQCVEIAAKARITSFGTAKKANTATLKTALTARTSTLKNAKTSKTAVKAANDTYKAAVKKASATLEGAKKTATDQFKTAADACKK